MRVLLLFIFVCAMVLKITAQVQSKRVIDIDEAIQIALQNNGIIQSKKMDVKSVEAMRKSSGEIPKLEFNAQLGQYNSIQFDQSYQFVQTIPFPSIFSARKKLNTSKVNSAQLQLQLSENDIKKQVRIHFYEIQFLLHNQQKLAYLDSLYHAFTMTANLLYNTGASGKLAISKAKAEKGKIDLLYQQNNMYLENAYQRMQALLNINEVFEVKTNTSFQPLSMSLLIDSATIANLPSVRLFYGEALIAEKEKKVEIAQSLPDITIGYTNQSMIETQTINGSEQYFGSNKRFNYFNVGLSIPLTFWANKAKTKSLTFQQKSAEMMARQEQLRLSAQIKSTLNQYKLALNRFQYFQEKALPNAHAILQTAKLAYETGDIGYSDYFDALQTATEIELNYLKSIDQLNETVININTLINQ